MYCPLRVGSAIFSEVAPQVVLSDKLFERVGGGTAVVACFGGECADGICVVFTLEIVAGTPQVILGNGELGLPSSAVNVGRAGKKISEGIVL